MRILEFRVRTDASRRLMAVYELHPDMRNELECPSELEPHDDVAATFDRGPIES